MWSCKGGVCSSVMNTLEPSREACSGANTRVGGGFNFAYWKSKRLSLTVTQCGVAGRLQVLGVG